LRIGSTPAQRAGRGELPPPRCVQPAWTAQPRQGFGVKDCIPAQRVRDTTAVPLGVSRGMRRLDHHEMRVVDGKPSFRGGKLDRSTSTIAISVIEEISRCCLVEDSLSGGCEGCTSATDESIGSNFANGQSIEEPSPCVSSWMRSLVVATALGVKLGILSTLVVSRPSIRSASKVVVVEGDAVRYQQKGALKSASLPPATPSNSSSLNSKVCIA